MLKRYNQHIVTGTLNTVSNGAVTGSTLALGNSSEKVADGTLSAYLILTAATASLTIVPSWQVSNDGTTFTAVKTEAWNPATIPVATGVLNVTTVVPAPRAVQGYQFTRCLLNVAGATGAAGDLFSIGYSYKQPD